jgi:hypothetical protein
MFIPLTLSGEYLNEGTEIINKILYIYSIIITDSSSTINSKDVYDSITNQFKPHGLRPQLFCCAARGATFLRPAPLPTLPPSRCAPPPLSLSDR